MIDAEGYAACHLCKKRVGYEHGIWPDAAPGMPNECPFLQHTLARATKDPTWEAMTVVAFMNGAMITGFHSPCAKVVTEGGACGCGPVYGTPPIQAALADPKNHGTEKDRAAIRTDVLDRHRKNLDFALNRVKRRCDEIDFGMTHAAERAQSNATERVACHACRGPRPPFGKRCRTCGAYQLQ